MPDRYIRRLNGPRGTFLLCAALLDFTHAVSCLPTVTESGAELPFGLDALNKTVPLVLYAAIWIAAGLFCISGALRTKAGAVREGQDIAAFAVTTGMLISWGSTYLLGWWLEDVTSRQWIFACVYFLIAGFVAAAARMKNPTERVEDDH